MARPHRSSSCPPFGIGEDPDERFLAVLAYSNTERRRPKVMSHADASAPLRSAELTMLIAGHP